MTSHSDWTPSLSHTRPLVLVLRIRQVLEQRIRPQDNRVHVFRQRTEEPTLCPIPYAHGRLGRRYRIREPFVQQNALLRACSGAGLPVRTGRAQALAERLVRASLLYEMGFHVSSTLPWSPQHSWRKLAGPILMTRKTARTKSSGCFKKKQHKNELA